ncbi:MAG TPA: c-type cytochrome, partial [Planctomycetaceae bacterium]|nr:c-type cytochrome [Planctomycetaceae bacterium]
QDADAPLNERLEAQQLLKWQPLADAGPVLAGQMAPQQPVELQTSALQVLCSSSDPAVARLVLDRWRLLSPALKAEALDRLLARPAWQSEVLTAIEGGELTASLIPPARFGLMLNSKDETIKSRALKLRGTPAPAQRTEALALYSRVLRDAASREQGQVVFKRECAQCHRLGNEGAEVGPGIASFRHRAPDEILLHILDPNREVSPAYLDHTVTLDDGRVLTGLIASETDSSVTLRRAQKVEDTVPRSQIEELASSGKSLMPEGLEQRIKPQEMADLILYLKQPE